MDNVSHREELEDCEEYANKLEGRIEDLEEGIKGLVAERNSLQERIRELEHNLNLCPDHQWEGKVGDEGRGWW